MRPPACVSCKWGTGTTCEKESNTQAQKDMKQRLQELQAERAKQDANWFSVPVETVKQDSQQAPKK